LQVGLIIKFLYIECNRNFQPLFWEELEELLGPILQPIVHPIFMALDNESFRSTVLTTTISFFLITAGIMWLLFEGLPLIANITEISEELPDMDSRRARPKSSEQLRRRQTAHIPRVHETTTRKEVEPKPSVVQQTGVQVTSELSKDQENSVLTVNVENTTDSSIQMVVVDIDLPEGIDSEIGSFRMQRLGTIDSGVSKAAVFRLREVGGDLLKLSGFIEFMSASYEVSKIDLPVPKYVED
jgi:hypothetical protein